MEHKLHKRDTLTSLEDICLRNLGISSLNDIQTWFDKSDAGSYRIDKMTDAVKLVRHCLNMSMPVSVIGDYDMDGVAGSSILYLGLKDAGFDDVNVIIPKRKTEGYGLKMVQANRCPDESLVICVDNGIASAVSVSSLKRRGCKVIILDHHSLPEGVQPPKADVLIDPEQFPESADFTGYCGADLAFRFVTLLNGKTSLFYQVLAGLGHVADVMPLREEGFVIVRHALDTIKDNRSVLSTGMQALLEVMNTPTEGITVKDIGFGLAPAINACSRIYDDGAYEKAFRLLTYTGDYSDATIMAREVFRINEVRKDLTKKANAEAENLMENYCLYGEAPLVLYIPDVPEGIIGLVSGNISQKYKVPVITLCDSENKTPEGRVIAKGSARSYGDYNVVKALSDPISKNLLRSYGGHPAAAGLSIARDDIPQFRQRLLDISEDYTAPDDEILDYDLEITPDQIPTAIDWMNRNIGLFGEGNPEPVFLIRDFNVIPSYGKYTNHMGSDGSSLKFYGDYANAVWFGGSEHFAGDPHKINIVGTLSQNAYRGRITNQVEIIDLDEIKTEKKMTSLAERLAVAAATYSK